jgi:DNA-binding beta-propeller fold protein YncE
MSTVFPTRTRLQALLTGLAVALLAALALQPAAASAEAPEELLRIPRFGGVASGEGTGRLDNPRGIATDPVTGHIFVAEYGNGRISEFTSWGEFVKSWGWGVVASGPDDNPRNEKQEVTVDATGGTFKLILVESSSPPIPENASAAVVQSALDEIQFFEFDPSGSFSVSGPDGGPWTIEFVGALADTDVAQIRTSTAGLSGASASATVTTVQPGANFEICVAAQGDVCKAGQMGSEGTGEFNAPGQLAAPRGVARGPDGSIYVADFVNEFVQGKRVQKFNPAGELLLMFGGEVNKTDHTNVCTKGDLEAGDECGAGTPGTGPSEFSTESYGNYIAVGADGTVFVGDAGRIQEFNPDGTYKGEIDLTGPLDGSTVDQLAIDLDGYLYVVIKGTNGTDGPFKLNPSGQIVGPSFSVDEPQAVAVDSMGNLYVVEDPFGFGDEEKGRVLEFDSSGELLVGAEDSLAESQVFINSRMLPGIATNVLGDGSGEPGDLYVGMFESVPGPDPSSLITAYGPLPQFEPAPPAPPTITAQYATAVGTDHAAVGAEINPHFFADTTYRIEYGTGECSEGGCDETADVLLGAERDLPAATAPVQLEGLGPGTTYHYRFIATAGPYTTKGLGETAAGGEATFTTRSAGQEGLSDNRVYEMVSPPDKNNGDVDEGVSDGPGKSVEPLQAATDGSAFTFASFTAFGAEPQGAPSANQYLSRRNPSGGWTTENITPPDEESYLTDPLRGFSQDLSRAAVVTLEPPLLPEAAEGFENLYAMDTTSGALQLATPGTPRIQIDRKSYCVEFAGASQDFSRVIFAAKGALLEEDPEAPSGYNLYEWSAVGGLSLVSMLPNGNPAQPKDVTGFGAGTTCDTAPLNHLTGAIAADGSRVFWSTAGALGALYARVNGEERETIQLDKKQGGSASGGGKFWRASEDGSEVFFTSTRALTPGASSGGTGDLYRYDFDAPEGARLSDLSGSEVLGVLGANANGNMVYFASDAVLAGNQGPTAGTATANAPNLYLWREGEGLRFVATLNGGQDGRDWSSQFAVHTARLTPDGEHLAFLSHTPLTGTDTTSQATGNPTSQVYLYDATTNTLRCASCNPTGARPLGHSGLPGWSTPIDQPRYLSDDGQRVFFESADALSEEDTNGKLDVYEFEVAGKGTCTASFPTYSPVSGGCLELLSSGESTADAHFLDASTSGEDVFFSTRSRLVPRDKDDNRDVYDARVGGFEPPLPPLPVPCEGEACREGNTPQPEAPPLPGTAAFQGPPNPPRLHCKKPRRRVVRNGKERCVKPKHPKRHKKHRKHVRSSP